jgi:hypothetical protein
MPLDSVCEPVAAFAKELTGDLTVGWPGVIRMPRVRTSNDFHIPVHGDYLCRRATRLMTGKRTAKPKSSTHN